MPAYSSGRLRRITQSLGYYVGAMQDMYKEHGSLFTVREVVKRAIAPVFLCRRYCIYRKYLDKSVGPVKVDDSYKIQVINSREDLARVVENGYNISPHVTQVIEMFLLTDSTGFLLFDNNSDRRELIAEAWILSRHYINTFCDAVTIQSDRAFVGGVETHKSHRRRGIQRYLLNDVFYHLKREGITRVDMFSNAGAITSGLLWKGVGAVHCADAVVRGSFGKRNWTLLPGQESWNRR